MFRFSDAQRHYGAFVPLCAVICFIWTHLPWPPTACAVNCQVLSTYVGDFQLTIGKMGVAVEKMRVSNDYYLEPGTLPFTNASTMQRSPQFIRHAYTPASVTLHWL